MPRTLPAASIGLRGRAYARAATTDRRSDVKSIVREFREFIMRGNVIDLAVAVVVGAAFTQVVNSFAKDVLLQVVGIIAGKPSFDQLHFTVNHSQINYGSFLTALVNFVIVAIAMFLVIKAMNAMDGFRKHEQAVEEAEVTEIQLLTEIRDALRSADRS
jgi:large conductance mechanosensitive channel